MSNSRFLRVTVKYGSIFVDDGQKKRFEYFHRLSFICGVSFLLCDCVVASLFYTNFNDTT